MGAVCGGWGEDTTQQAVGLRLRTDALLETCPVWAGQAHRLLMWRLSCTVEKVLRSTETEVDVYGIHASGCVVQLLSGLEWRLLWKHERRRRHPWGSFCGGIRKAGKFLGQWACVSRAGDGG